MQYYVIILYYIFYYTYVYARMTKRLTNFSKNSKAYLSLLRRLLKNKKNISNSTFVS